LVDASIIGVILSSIAIVIAGLSFYVSWIRLKRERPQVALASSLASYDLSRPAPNPLDKASLKVNLDVIAYNLGNARGSITDLKMIVRYAHGAVTHPLVRDTLDPHVYSARPINFSKIVPFDLEEYGSHKVSLTFEFPTLFARLLDRGIMPINIRNPRKQDWNDFPIIYELVASTPSGPVVLEGVIFRRDQPQSKEVHGSLGWYEEWKMEKEFSPLEYYKT